LVFYTPQTTEIVPANSYHIRPGQSPIVNSHCRQSPPHQHKILLVLGQPCLSATTPPVKIKPPSPKSKLFSQSSPPLL